MLNGNCVTRVVISGANGLLGYHARAALFAENCAADFKKEARKYEYIELPRISDDSIDRWVESLASADLVLHLAGINRAEPEELELGNVKIAELLVGALTKSSSQAHVIYANSTHAGSDSPYGRGKRVADELLGAWASSTSNSYTNVVLPHLFGENALPYYNNVTATLCHQLVNDQPPCINHGARVELYHAGAAIESMLKAYESIQTGNLRLVGRHISVVDLYNLLLEFRSSYKFNTFPDLSNSFVASLFNTYRSVDYRSAFPKLLELHSDVRGSLFEAVKGGGGGQTFLSWTKPGIERGNHFHLKKIERFLVVSGNAEIRVRPLFDKRVDRYLVSGDVPSYIDMPTLHTHSIINIGSEPLLTLFWTHEVFDAENPDTFAHPVDSL